jgi:hypothetical protein
MAPLVPRFVFINAADMESVIKVDGILSCISSYAVSLEPWLYGLVSVQ